MIRANLVLFGLVLIGSIIFAADQCDSCNIVQNSCTNLCEQEYGDSSQYRGTYISEDIEQKCSGSHEAASEEVGECYTNNYNTMNSCMQECGDSNECQNSCVDSYNQQNIEVCGNQYLDLCHTKCINTCNQNFVLCQNNCSNETIVNNMPSKCTVSITSEYDGVSADGVSSITFKLQVQGKYDYFYFGLDTYDGVLKGKVERPDPLTIIFTPDEADAQKNYLDPQDAFAIAKCYPTGGELGDEVQTTIPFTVEQPPLFFVHGFLSSAHPLWDNFEGRAKQDGWQYSDMDYPWDQDIAQSSVLLKGNLNTFISDINHGEYYGNRKISATKADIIAHSMGGLVTRAYIGGSYDGNIRKFVMLGTPNHGSWDAKILPKKLGGVSGTQLRPNNAFLNGLNSQALNPEIDYHTVAGTGWTTDSAFLEFSFQGDGIVLVESVQLPGVPLYCTYDAHTGIIYWLATMSPTALVNNGGGWTDSTGGTLPTSDASYGITRSAILTGTAVGVAPCGTSTPSGQVEVRGTVKSPVTLHAYDSEGNHVGPTATGVENKIGIGVYYSNGSETEHQTIRIIGNKNITFKIIGIENGEFGFELMRLEQNGSVSIFTFEGTAVPERVYTINANEQNPKMITQEPPVQACLPAFAIVALFAGVFCIKQKS